MNIFGRDCLINVVKIFMFFKVIGINGDFFVNVVLDVVLLLNL